MDDMNKTPQNKLSNKQKADVDIAVKEVVKKYHKTLKKLATT